MNGMTYIIQLHLIFSEYYPPTFLYRYAYIPTNVRFNLNNII